MLWLFFMVWVMFVDLTVLAAVSMLLLASFRQAAWYQFSRYVRRSRWLLLILTLVHAYSLQGTPLWPVLGAFGPSQPGVYSGLLQSWRLLLILGMLAVVMTRLSREALLLGIYTLSIPLRHVGIAPERIALRIWLTMRYADSLMHETQSMSFKQRLQQLSHPPSVTESMMQPLVLELKRWGWLDYACIMGMILLVLWVR